MTIDMKKIGRGIIEVQCSKCKVIFDYEEPSKLHLSHKDKYMLCSDCESMINDVYLAQFTDTEDY